MKTPEFQKFCELIFAHAQHSLCTGKRFSGKRNWDSPKYNPIKSPEEIEYDTKLNGEKVSIGGVSGGSCWNDGEHHNRPYINNDHEPIELTALDTLLEKICPTITFLQYKKLTSMANITQESETKYEYYGNQTDYAYLSVKIGDLYEALLALNVLPKEYGV